MIPSPDFTLIENLVRTYLDALHEGDANRLATVFHETSALTQWHEGELKITPRDVWLEAVRKRPSPKATGMARHEHVLLVDVVGPDMAFVKLKCAIPPRHFTDLLSLLRIDGRWQVAQKVFMTESAA